MIRYAKITNEKTKEVSVGLGTNTKFYKSIGMTEMDVEQAYNGQWYVKGYAPEEPETEIQYRIRKIRDNALEQTDKYMVVDFPISDEDRKTIKQYRQYLRDYTKQDNWWESLPDGFADWRANIEKVDEILKESTEQTEPKD